jgi:hypothetical protein
MFLGTFDKSSRVCRTHDKLWMLVASKGFLGLQIESESGFYCLSISLLCTYDVLCNLV